MSYTVYPTSRFKKELRSMQKRGYPIQKLRDVVALLQLGEKLPAKYRDHVLLGDFAGYRECHVAPDWLLIYEKEEDRLFLYLLRTGSHSDLF